jgi:alginate O-acetyltransferase complex protein AlgI
MLFNTLHFAVLFTAVLIAYFSMSHKRQNALLLAASYFFYACWDWRFLSLIFLSTAVDFYVGAALARISDARNRKRIVTWSVVFNLGFLAVFKYYNFFSDGLQTLLSSLGFNVHITTLEVAIPVGISFYTFQSMSYAIDIYRREIRPTERFNDFALSVAFFPHMVAGPIQRARSLIDQVERPRVVTRQDFADGLHLILWGLFKKMVIADNLALTVDKAFSTGPHDPSLVAVGTLAFALQIYGDFSGYTDIARGAARLLGFDLMLNFNLPYFARNPQDFWRRWHISLSTWLRDYLYFSLGGSRLGEWKTYRNLLLTMVLGGLWHGASWTFVIWGFYHGSLLCAHRFAVTYLPMPAATSGLWKVCSIVLMFGVTLYGWMIFRATDVWQLWSMTKALGGFRPDVEVARGIVKILFYCWPLFLLQFFQLKTGDLMCLRKAPIVLQALFYLIIFYYIAVLGVFDAQSFIYFQF